jgi:protein-S-isoprenylcysteine O-methyltransferase Ste14
MIFSWESWLPAALLIGCIGSFAWAIRNFFTQPVGFTPTMRLISGFGAAFGILHLFAILSNVNLSAERSLAGSVLYCCSVGLFWWAIKTSHSTPLSAAFSPDLPTHLVANGPYRVIRHPLYCSYLICWLAGWVVTARLWLAPTVAVMVVIYLIAAAQEEQKFMRSQLADAYRQYRSRTALIVPNPLKLISSWRKTPWETHLGSSQSSS